MKAKLNPCPRCGTEIGWKNGAIYCKRCNISFYKNTMQETISLWNKGLIGNGLYSSILELHIKDE